VRVRVSVKFEWFGLGLGLGLGSGFGLELGLGSRVSSPAPPRLEGERKPKSAKHMVMTPMPSSCTPVPR
jgi:hypothetical protein